MRQPTSSIHRLSNRASEAHSLRTLNTFAVDLMSIPSVEDLFWYVAQNVVGKLGFVDCVIYQADEDQTKLTQVAAWGEKNPYGRNIINTLVIPFGRGITGQVAKGRKPIIIDDLMDDVDYIPDTEPARSEICVPLICRGKIAGVIDSEHPDIAAFGEPELEILSTVAAMTSAKLELLTETGRSQRRYEDLVVAHTQLTQETKNRKSLENKLHEARKQEAIGRLAGRFAQEVNNLLRLISSNIELLELDAPEVKSHYTLRDLRTTSSRGEQLIRDMLAFAQKTRLSPKTHDLNVLVADFCAENRALFSCRITEQYSKDIWPVSVDQTAVGNILLALLRNSIEASAEECRLTIETENVLHMFNEGQHFASELAPGRYVRVSISDQGAGIPIENIAQIFDPFFSTKKFGEGTGLGLSMVLGVMRQSGGTVAVRSQVSEGSTFELYFPAISTRPDW